ncbi:MAG: GTPase [Planctomycetota bacterium]
MYDVLASPLTAPRTSAVAVVLLDGNDSLTLISTLFQPISGEFHVRENGLFYGRWLSAPGGEPIDDALVLTRLADQSKTRRIQIEIHFHGSPLLVADALDALAKQGARVTTYAGILERACRERKLTRIELEAELALPNARTEKQLGLLLQAAELKRMIERAATSAFLLARDEQPKSGSPSPHPAETWRSILLKCVSPLIQSYPLARRILKTWTLTLVGPPSAGKSTLMNALSGSDASVEHPLPGTTRDIVSRVVALGDFAYHLNDCAGLMSQRNQSTLADADRKAQELARAAIRQSDIILFIVDGSVSPTAEDYASAGELMNQMTEIDASSPAESRRPPILGLIINKSDMAIADGISDWQSFFDLPDSSCITMSALSPDAARVVVNLLDVLQTSTGDDADIALKPVIEPPVSLFTDRQYQRAKSLAELLGTDADILSVSEAVQALLYSE